MLSTLLPKIGIPVLINVLTETLSNMNIPAAKSAAEALKNVDTAIKNGAITQEQVMEANRHAERMAELQLQEIQTGTAQVNETMRVETASQDAYVRRMRPTFGYFMAVTWAAQMLAIAYIIVFETEKSVFVLNAMGALSAIWAMGLSVLGIYVYKRSEEKKALGPEVIGWGKSKK